MIEWFLTCLFGVINNLTSKRTQNPISNTFVSNLMVNWQAIYFSPGVCLSMAVCGKLCCSFLVGLLGNCQLQQPLAVVKCSCGSLSAYISIKLIYIRQSPAWIKNMQVHIWEMLQQSGHSSFLTMHSLLSYVFIAKANNNANLVIVYFNDFWVHVLFLTI